MTTTTTMTTTTPQIFPICGATESRIALGSATHPNFLLDGGFYTVESFATNGFPETREHTHTTTTTNDELLYSQNDSGSFFFLKASDDYNGTHQTKSPHQKTTGNT